MIRCKNESKGKKKGAKKNGKKKKGSKNSKPKPPTFQKIKNKVKAKTPTSQKIKTKVKGKPPTFQKIKTKAKGRKNRKMENTMDRAADDDTPTVENNCKCEDSPSSLEYGGLDYADEDGDCGEFKWSEVGHIPNV